MIFLTESLRRCQERVFKPKHYRRFFLREALACFFFFLAFLGFFLVLCLSKDANKAGLTERGGALEAEADDG
jgi:fumarate reductase subunit C